MNRIFQISAILLVILNCSSGTKLSNSQIQESRILSDKSKFLSGQLDIENSRLSQFAKKQPYERYKEVIHGYLRNFQIKMIEPIKKWREEQVSKVHSDHVIYPFSGPDFLNIYSLYQNAKKYVMIGLESSGQIPDFEKYSDKDLSNGLNDMQNALNSISRRNFFVTKAMRKNVSRSRIKGTVPIFLTYLGFLDLTPVSIRYFKINPLGQITYPEKDENSHGALKENFAGVEIQFLEKDKPQVLENVKSIYYLSADISNLGLRKKPEILKFLGEMGTVAVSFKAASYLPHSNKFSSLRSYVHKNAEVIIMDDTGPTINSFDKNWDIKVFGNYKGPIKDFSYRYQRSLAKLFKEQHPEKINFRFGYGYKDQQHIIKLSKKTTEGVSVGRGVTVQ